MRELSALFLWLAQGEVYNPRADVLYRFSLWATLVGVMGAFIGLGLLIWQTVLTRRSVNALVASERAWITVNIDWAPGYSGMFDTSENVDGRNVDGHITTIRMKYKNDGRTPAWITERRACLTIIKSLPDKPPLEHCEIIQHGVESLGARNAIHLGELVQRGFDVLHH